MIRASASAAPLDYPRHLALAVLGCVCSVWCLAASADSPAAAPSSAAPAASSYATALDRLRPLLRVDGEEAPSKICDASGGDPATIYREAIDHAATMDSYALLIWRDGRCRLAHYFEPHGPNLRPESASMHKTVLALLIASAMADGKLGGPDTPVARYLPEWRSDPRGQITLRDLLTMSSGLEPFAREGGMESAMGRFIFGPKDALAMSLSQPAAEEPGVRFRYDNTSSQILLIILERAVAMAYPEYLAQRLWRPIGAGDAFLWAYENPPGLARGYSSLLARAEDWLRIGLLIKDAGSWRGRQLIPAAMIDAMTTPSAAYANYGWQLWLGREYEPYRIYDPDHPESGFSASEPFATDDMIYLDGFGGQRVYISRKEDLVVVRVGDMKRDWDDSILPNLVLRAEPSKRSGPRPGGSAIGSGETGDGTPAASPGASRSSAGRAPAG